MIERKSPFISRQSHTIRRGRRVMVSVYLGKPLNSGEGLFSLQLS
jgi:hypothetical protein